MMTANLADLLADVDLADLADNGDTIDLPDGSQLLLVIEPDEFRDLDDDDWYGRLEWTKDSDYGARRPSWANGSARVIDSEYYRSLWWQPPSDVTDVDGLLRTLKDILEYGYVVVVVEWLSPLPDQQGWTEPRRSVIANAVLGGVEAMYDRGYLASVVADLVSEIG